MATASPYPIQDPILTQTIGGTITFAPSGGVYVVVNPYPEYKVIGQNFTYTAVPNPGYEFARWEFATDMQRLNNQSGNWETYYTYDGSGYYHSVNPYTSPNIDYNGSAFLNELLNGSGYSELGQDWYGDPEWRRNQIRVSAVFQRLPYTPTHLLVNSYDRSSPVQLVHDPASNLLVADY